MKVRTTKFNKVVGYISPTKNYNKGRKKEFDNRKSFFLKEEEK